MAKQVINTSGAPAAIGPYSQGIRIGNYLFLSGQIPLDPATGNIVVETAAEQAKQVLKNIEAILNEASATPADVVKTTIFLTDLSEFAAVNEVYGGFFKSDPPARSTVQVGALPKGARVEIEAIAVVE